MYKRQVHGAGWASDDHMGKRPLASRVGFDTAPPDSGVDSAHIRAMMVESRTAEGNRVFSETEIDSLRVHGCKATLISAGIHYNQRSGQADSTTGLRHQGGWRGKAEETMPDTYLRESQVLALEFQERVIAFLREGHEVVALPAARLTGSQVVPEPEDLEARSGGSATGRASEASETSNSSSSSSEDEEPAEPAMIKSLLWTMTTGRFHAASQSGEELLPECGRRSGNAVAVSSDDVSVFLNSSKSIRFACDLCFPAVSNTGLPCKNICGFPGLGGVCRNRCIHTQSNLSLFCLGPHTCKYHISFDRHESEPCDEVSGEGSPGNSSVT